jgi:hypothetical protein
MILTQIISGDAHKLKLGQYAKHVIRTIIVDCKVPHARAVVRFTRAVLLVYQPQAEKQDFCPKNVSKVRIIVLTNDISMIGY